MGAASGLLLNTAGVAADSDNQVDESDLTATSAEHHHGHHPGPGARTVETWAGSSQGFSYNIVGADPASEDGSTIGVDIVVVNVTLGDRTFRGTDVLGPVLASPLFQNNDYSSTGMASSMTLTPSAGGELSAGNDGVQTLDAIMRSQFNKVGTGYHLYLAPSAVHKPVSIVVPADKGTIMTSRMGQVSVAVVDQDWFLTNVESLTASLHWLKPHRLSLFLTNDVFLHKIGTSPTKFVFGDHGWTDTTAEGNGSDGRQAIQTYVWASWITAGFFKPTLPWALKDITALSHEIVEWANDPFGANTVPSWFASGYGCQNIFETGDPVVGLGFSVGSNTFIDPADPSASTSNPFGFSDGTYHVEDEVFLPWFIGMSPNTMSQPLQGTTDTDAGRYTFMGKLNRVPRFLSPSTGC